MSIRYPCFAFIKLKDELNLAEVYPETQTNRFFG